ncbi:MAG TPA: hypothetical protein VF535_03475 [Allosphingosinicella sp.]|jgi:hypothetical protein
MVRVDIAVAAGLALIAAASASAREKAEEPKERKICRSVQMSGRITPQRICRKVERPAPEGGMKRDDRSAAEEADAKSS